MLSEYSNKEVKAAENHDNHFEKEITDEDVIPKLDSNVLLRYGPDRDDSENEFSKQESQVLSAGEPVKDSNLPDLYSASEVAVIKQQTEPAKNDDQDNANPVKEQDLLARSEKSKKEMTQEAAQGQDQPR